MQKDYIGRVKEIKEKLAQRASEVSHKINSSMMDESEETGDEISAFFEEWEKMAECYDEDHFYYGEKFMEKLPAEDEGRLMKVFNTGRNDQAYDTMTSMRHVHSSLPGNVLIWEEE